jgi:hypothetical protein
MLDELRTEAIAELERRGYDVSGKTCGGPFLCPQFFWFSNEIATFPTVPTQRPARANREQAAALIELSDTAHIHH